MKSERLTGYLIRHADQPANDGYITAIYLEQRFAGASGLMPVVDCGLREDALVFATRDAAEKFLRSFSDRLTEPINPLVIEALHDDLDPNANRKRSGR